MGLLKGFELTLDNLIGYSKLQEVLELLVSALKEQEQAIQPLADQQRLALEQLQATVERLDSQQAAMHAVETRLESHQAAIGSQGGSSSTMKAEELKELLGRLETQGELAQQLRAEVAALSNHNKELTEKLDADCERLARSAEQQNNAAVDRMSAMEQRSSDLVAQLQGLDASLQKFQDALGGEQRLSDLQHLLDDRRREFENRKNVENAGMTDGMMQTINQELMKMCQDLTNTTMAPIETKVAALEAIVESTVLVRLGDHENRIQCLERIQRDFLDQVSESQPVTHMNAVTIASDLGTHNGAEASPEFLEIKQEISDLSTKLAEVIAALGDHGSEPRETALPPVEADTLETALLEADLEAAAIADRQHVLNQVSHQLEQRIASLEGKLANSSNQDLTEMGDSLKQVQTIAKSLEGIVSKDVQPKLDNHKLQMTHLADELSQLCRRIEGMVTKTSLATTSHCLACYDRRIQASNKVIVGSDGKTYLQTSGASPQNHMNSKTHFAWSDVHGSMINSLAKPKLNDRFALQGGSRSPLRRSRNPNGNDGTTWVGAKSAGAKENVAASMGAMRRAASTGSVEHGRGLPRITGLPPLRVVS